MIVAGEASGDLHGANLARAIRELAPRATLLGAGGHRMREAGVEILADTTAHAAVGIVEASTTCITTRSSTGRSRAS